MKKIKIPVKKKRTNKEDYGKYSFEDPFKPSKTLKIIFYAIVILLPVLLAFIYLRFAVNTNKFMSFPLDDPWIHLTFGKNLVDYFSFSYFKNEMVTAGSTSPLYTILVAVGFLIVDNEMILSYALGVGFFAFASLAFYKLSMFEFDRENLFALLCTLIFIIDKWMNFISLSGMETTMFIFLLLACAYFYRIRKPVPFAVFLGLIMWTRPDGVAFIAAVILDYILVRFYSKDQLNLKLFSAKDLKIIGVIFGAIIGAYFLMNFMLSGTLLPNTYNAKLTYYSPEFRSRWDFLSIEVWDYFKEGAYYVIMLGFIFSFGKLIYDLYKKTYNQNTLYIAFALIMVFIYWYNLPYAHRFGRYMMPVIPFFILVGTLGFRDFARISNKYTSNALFSRSLFYILISITYFMGVKNYDENREQYALQCRYIHDRQVLAAQWFKKYSKEGDVIATHDVGAIGYYSGRKVVDVAGLVTPELISKINDRNYVEYMTDYLKNNGVTHLAFLREWYRVANQNPLYSTPDGFVPEIMDIYNFNPQSTHIISREANELVMYGLRLVNQKAAQQLIQFMNRLLTLEPDYAYAYYLRAYGHSILENFPQYEADLRKALSIQPDFKDGNLYFGIYLSNNRRFEEAKFHLDKVLEMEPLNVLAKNTLSIVNDSLNARALNAGNNLPK
ncbi:MAG TPA: hypothetical protein PK536_10685 [Ignavibacteria bacterium]|nr:hypothetical protein [Bacteroidota bacterium]HRI85898.1 hypothetical protein [Ignavibacteria bacterium]HRJ99308.1 hypothetical protein [Ignavibacteria bacterium]